MQQAHLWAMVRPAPAERLERKVPCIHCSTVSLAETLGKILKQRLQVLNSVGMTHFRHTFEAARFIGLFCRLGTSKSSSLCYFGERTCKRGPCN